MIAGAALSHNFSLAGKPDSISDGSVITGGISGWGMAAVVIGILFCLAIGFAMTIREENQYE